MGLLGNGFDDPQTQFNLALASGLLSSRGGFGQALGQAMPMAMQARQQGQSAIAQRQNQEIQQQLVNSQIAEHLAKSAKQKDAEEKDKQIQELAARTLMGGPVNDVGPPDQSGGYGTRMQQPDTDAFVRGLAGIDYKAALPYMASKLGGGSNVPSAIQVFEYWDKLPPEKQRAMLDTMRQNYKVANIGEVPNVIGLGPTPTVNPLSTLPEIAGAKGAISAAESAGRTTGTKTAEAQIDLPKIESNAKYMKTLVNGLISHPALAMSTGVFGVVPAVPGTQQADFVTRLDQIKGKQFMQAYETLKGGGQITEIEGQKATDALSRMKRATRPEDFVSASKEFISEVDRLTEIAKQRAGRKPPEQDRSSIDQRNELRKQHGLPPL